MPPSRVAQASSLPVPRLPASPLATLIYDATVAFCRHFLDPRSRTVDQMTQAGRTARQNIAEGSRASAVSSGTDLRWGNVTRASLEQLLRDYEDFLRQRNLPQWTKDNPEAVAVGALAKHSSLSNRPDSSLYQAWLTSTDPAAVANAIICLIRHANYLLDQQIRGLQRTLIEGGGYTENLAAARTTPRNGPPSPLPISSGPIPGAPSCPRCGKPMALRTAKSGARPGSQFWGCSLYPACKGTRPV